MAWQQGNSWKLDMEPAEIAALPGFGKATAEKIVRFWS